MFVKLNLDFFYQNPSSLFFSKIFCVCLIASRIFLDHLTFKAAQLLDPSEGLKKWKFQGSGYVFFNNCIDIY